MTVQEWRKKHKRCQFCKHCVDVIPHTALVAPYYCCNAKEKIVNQDLPRPFCRLFELKED